MNQSTASHRSESSLTPDSCHQAYQHWQQIIRQQEEEIGHLRTLLLDVMNLYNCRSLRHDVLDYYQDLNQLQLKINRLHHDLLCEGVDCAVINVEKACVNSRFGLSATLERHTNALVGEFSRIKGGCLQFLSGMMSLNLL
ncbi:hypothetical protein [Spirosoma agri]|uniref:Uncharacterized protein n=1 Tax=Spirosoma agri TaxID=1987381 RepID=A0A6M0II25_9BACT|nr:hypothetical protein [Spirosoma agri]NEU67910.1 hypothetical protein [Spirosoma agri]